jgi:hypothetical protein
MAIEESIAERVIREMKEYGFKKARILQLVVTELERYGFDTPHAWQVARKIYPQV